jgi:hypothetical protein
MSHRWGRQSWFPSESTTQAGKSHQFVWLARVLIARRLPVRMNQQLHFTASDTKIPTRIDGHIATVCIRR